MQFANLEELIRHIVTNDLSLEGLDFPFEQTSDEQPIEVAPQGQEEVPAGEVEPTITDELPATDELTDGLVLHFASGDVVVAEASDGSIMVDSFQMTPNACGVGTIVLEGRTITLNMCQMDDTTVAYLPTSKKGVHTYNNPIKITAKN